MNSGKDYKARAVDVAQPIMAGGPVGGNQGGDDDVAPFAFDPQGGGKQTRLGASQVSTGALGRTKTPAIAFSCKDDGRDAAVDMSPTLRSMGHDGSHANAGGQVAIAFNPVQGGTSPGAVVPPLGASDGGGNQGAVAVALRGREGGATAEMGGNTAHALRASTGGGDKPHVLAFTQNQRDEVRTMEVAGALPAEPGAKQQTYAQTGTAVRRLTPRECERLQGLADDWTLVPYRGKPAADGPRYKSIGNSMPRPVMRWLGERIDLVRSLFRDEGDQ